LSCSIYYEGSEFPAEQVLFTRRSGEEVEMKALVTYFSQTGNTEKVARAIYDAIQTADKDFVEISDVRDVESYDLVFCGFPVQAHSVPPKVEAFLEDLPEGTKVALFGTHGSLRGGELAVQAFYHAITITPKLRILGTFGCRGKVKRNLLEALMKKPENIAWANEAQGATGHPDQADLEDAAEFARTMITKARTL
jgi:flavodoxin